jgi:outer membrane protein assembly factor BamB
VIHHGKVLLSAGKVAALDLNSGAVLWTSNKEHHPGYATPVVFSRGGKDHIASLDGKGFSVLDAADGKEIAWSPFKAQFDMTATTPALHRHEGDLFVFISSNSSSEMLHFDGRRLGQSWTSKEFKNSMNNSVQLGELMYGIDGKQGAGRFVCITADDGIVKWARDGFGFGNVIGLGEGHLLSLTESGELVMIRPSPEGYQELSRRQVLGKTCWTTPVYAGGRIYVRNDRGDVRCLARP